MKDRATSYPKMTAEIIVTRHDLFYLVARDIKIGNMGDSVTRKGISAAAEAVIRCLVKRQEIINNLNVFPVPDGDTGTNLHFTMKAGVEQMEQNPESGVAEAMRELARGALMGSRGNSGVIFSQLLEGVASSFVSSSEGGVPELLEGFKEGVVLAYESVQEPVEGTMLTVLRETAEGLTDGRDMPMGDFLYRAYGLACESLRRTPVMLGVLAESGVVDAGGAGMVAVLEGVVSSLGYDGEKFEWEKFESGPEESQVKHPLWEITFSVECSEEELSELESRIQSLGDSLVVARSSSPFRVHIHTESPERVLDIANNLGKTSGLDIIRF